jgi:hypothetical protein
MNAGRLVALHVLIEREQARKPAAAFEWAIGMKTQRYVDRQCARIDAANFGQIADGQRVGDRLGGVPKRQRPFECAGLVLLLGLA